ncbi:MAG: hypothetical protein ACAF41_12590 [Leptolyngbya sp. BL-A-14]
MEIMIAERRTVPIGLKTVDGFMLPDTTYTMSQTQAAEVIKKPESHARRFLTSTAIKTRMGGTFAPVTVEIEPEATRVSGRGRFNALPLKVVSAYWLTQAMQGNREAGDLCWALLTESLERRFDVAFGRERSQAEYDMALARSLDQIRTLESSLNELGEAYAQDDNLAAENRFLWQFLSQHGLDPYR